MKVINLTPHDVVVRLDGRDIVFPKSGLSARVSVKFTSCDSLVIDGDNIPVVTNEYGEVNAPAPKEGTIYIVSLQALEMCKRKDMFAPDTSPEGVVRDSQGKIIAVKRFVTVKS